MSDVGSLYLLEALGGCSRGGVTGEQDPRAHGIPGLEGLDRGADLRQPLTGPVGYGR